MKRLLQNVQMMGDPINCAVYVEESHRKCLINSILKNDKILTDWVLDEDFEFC